jgi:hypothetical protein
MSCAICVLGIGGGLLIARKLGVDEYVVMVWISGLNTALAYYLSRTINKKIISNKFILAALFYTLTYLYLQNTGQMNHRVFVGLTVGMETYFVAHFIERLIYKKNNSKSLFPFQRAIIPILFLILASLTAALTF